MEVTWNPLGRLVVSIGRVSNSLRASRHSRARSNVSVWTLFQVVIGTATAYDVKPLSPGRRWTQ